MAVVQIEEQHQEEVIPVDFLGIQMSLADLKNLEVLPCRIRIIMMEVSQVEVPQATIREIILYSNNGLLKETSNTNIVVAVIAPRQQQKLMLYNNY